MKSLGLNNGNHPGFPTHHNSGHTACFLISTELFYSQLALLLFHMHICCSGFRHPVPKLPSANCLSNGLPVCEPLSLSLHLSRTPLCHYLFYYKIVKQIFAIHFHYLLMNTIAFQPAFKVLKYHKQHFLPCQVLIHDMQLSRRKNKRPDKIRIFLLSFYLISYSAFFTMFLTIVNSQIHLPWLQWQILFCNMGIRLCQTPDSPAHHLH